MKILMAMDSRGRGTVYINVSRISSFHLEQSPDTSKTCTKIYFEGSKCEVKGDITAQLRDFMSKEEDYGTLDVTDGSSKEEESIATKYRKKYGMEEEQ